MRKLCIIATATIASLSVASNALAADCESDVVLVRGSSASQKLIEAVAKVAVGQGIKIVYSNADSSCGGVYEAVTPVATTTGRPATANTAYDAAAPSATCTMNPPRAADIGVSDVYAPSCAGLAGIVDTTLPAGVTDTLGPVQAFTLAVYDDPSFPVAISSAAAFNIFGITARGGDASYAVAPWTVPADVFGRVESSGTWQTWARNLGLISQKPVTSNPLSGAGGVLAALNTANRASAIGIIALNDIVPSAGVSPKVRPLAFKAKGQDFAYYPSSTSTSSDLINVRDGHYQTWANLHFFARKDTAGDYSAPVKKVLGLLEGKDAVAAVTKIRAVPNCAMQVSRASDGGDFKLYTPAAPCGCFFEATAAGTAPASCKTCTEGDNSTCGSTGQCVFGYCEAK